MSDSNISSGARFQDGESGKLVKQRWRKSSLSHDLSDAFHDLEGMIGTQSQRKYKAVSVSAYLADENTVSNLTHSVSSGADTHHQAVVGTIGECQHYREALESSLKQNINDRIVIIDESESEDDQSVIVLALIRFAGNQDYRVGPANTTSFEVHLASDDGESYLSSKVSECDTLTGALLLAINGDSAQSRELIRINETPNRATVDAKIRALVVCNAYPSDGQIYRNGFIHSRVEKYVESGIDVVVYYLHEPAGRETEYTYRGITVKLGNADTYREYLKNSSYDVYLVHFATERMIEPIREYAPDKKAIVWIHGFEAEAWHRRWFNYLESPEAMSKILEMKDSYYNDQLSFNNHLYTNSEEQFHFVNVSDWFKTHIVEPDSGVKFDPKFSSTIPNLIDGEFFDYRPKGQEQRTKILSIRPYASHKYANDLSVNAILQLSERPWFEDMEFSIYGHGRLFKAMTEPLSAFDNVHLYNRFLTREEIREAHSKHGIFLAPTRFDSQGVSTNEAMSSGLVPISSDVSAIPEFIHHFESGLLAKQESSNELARLIEILYFDSELFLGLSKCAATRIRKIAGYGSTAAREIRLIQDCVGS
ncbi:glycosyltransferase family 4 protein [Bacillus subtilis]|nr:glycosyltransferase family 4 protein [Bacillus subtilis]